MNLLGRSEQAAVTAIAVQFPYALSYGEFSWQPKSVRAVAKPFSLITKSQIRPTALPPNAKRSDDKTGIEKSKKVTLTIGTTKAGFNKHGLNAIQTTGASIANQIQALAEKPFPAQDHASKSTIDAAIERLLLASPPQITVQPEPRIRGARGRQTNIYALSVGRPVYAIEK